MADKDLRGKMKRKMKIYSKKKTIIAALAVTVLLGGVLGGALAISASERAIVPDMNFVGETIELSLAEAVEIMQKTGSRAETALLNKAADEAVAKGHAESVQNMTDYWKNLNEQWKDLGGIPIGITIESERAGMTDTNEKIMKLRRDFAKGQLANNHKAELNEIEAMTVELYYGIMLAEENLKIAKDSLANSKLLNQNIQNKYKRGAVARIDTIVSKNQVDQAEGRVASAETGVKKAKMSFNLLMGYDLMQAVELKDKLVVKEVPEGNLTGFIEGALDNRNEIKVITMAWEIQDILLNNLRYRYPQNSATYLNQQAATMQAKKSYDDIPIQIEMDIRSKYMDLQDKGREVELAKANQRVADEAYRLSKISFDAGVNTLADVEEAGIMAYQAALGVAAAITEYNITVHNFNHAIDVGTVRVPL